MAKIQISTRLEEDLLNGLNKLILNDSAALTYRIETLLKMNINNYNKALKSLINKMNNEDLQKRKSINDEQIKEKRYILEHDMRGQGGKRDEIKLHNSKWVNELYKKFDPWQVDNK